MLFLPTLFDQYNTGPSEVNLTKRETIIMGRSRKKNETKTNNKSNIRFKCKAPLVVTLDF